MSRRANELSKALLRVRECLVRHGAHVRECLVRHGAHIEHILHAANRNI